MKSLLPVFILALFALRSPGVPRCADPFLALRAVIFSYASDIEGLPDEWAVTMRAQYAAALEILDTNPEAETALLRLFAKSSPLRPRTELHGYLFSAANDVQAQLQLDWNSANYLLTTRAPAALRPKLEKKLAALAPTFYARVATLPLPPGQTVEQYFDPLRKPVAALGKARRKLQGARAKFEPALIAEAMARPDGVFAEIIVTGQLTNQIAVTNLSSGEIALAAPGDGFFRVTLDMMTGSDRFEWAMYDICRTDFVGIWPEPIRYTRNVASDEERAEYLCNDGLNFVWVPDNGYLCGFFEQRKQNGTFTAKGTFKLPLTLLP